MVYLNATTTAINTKICLTHISHFPELLFLEFGQREVILYLKVNKHWHGEKKSQTQWKVEDSKIWDTLRKEFTILHLSWFQKNMKTAYWYH
jgi:hypothetical protein